MAISPPESSQLTAVEAAAQAMRSAVLGDADPDPTAPATAEPQQAITADVAATTSVADLSDFIEVSGLLEYDPAAISREVQAAVQAVQGTDALLFINDHWQEAIAAGAYGVHLGQEDLGTANLDAIRQAGLRLGLSTHGYAEMCLADTHAPSYMAMGAVFPTTLKRMKTAAQGTGRLHAYAQLLREYPLVAIGGIDEARFADVRRTGVGSIAVVRALVAAADPEGVARDLMRRLAGV